MGSDSSSLLHNTIARNSSGDASGILVGGVPGIITLTNAILVSHTVDLCDDGEHWTLQVTLWGTGNWANESDWGGAGTIFTGTVNVWGAPAFVDPGAGNDHPLLPP